MNARLALGFCDNIDYEIAWDAKVFERSIVRYDIRDDELDVERAVSSERELVLSILSFLKAGIGGERTVASSEILERFSRNFAKRITLGGTGVRAAVAMRKLGHTSALHLVTVNDHVRKLLPRDCPYVCSNPHDSLYPHLIVQFAKGSVVTAGDIDIRTEQANRIIYHRDDDNMAMKLDEGFSELVTAARVFLISGFNAMRDEALLEKRLGSVARIMEHLPSDALVFYEDAGFYEPRFRQTIAHFLAAKADIVSLNEDELREYLGRTLDSLHPRQIAAALAELREVIPVPVIVVHTRYWALAYGSNATRFAAALESGVTLATTRFCYGDDFTAAAYRKIEGSAANEAGAAVADAITKMLGNEVCCVPVAHVDPPKATTIGLGDAFVGGFLAALARRS